MNKAGKACSDRVQSAWLQSQGKQIVTALLEPRYEVLEFVGAGASAVVYRVADVASKGEIKAAKLTSLASTDGEVNRLEALRAEFCIASRLAHPNLLRHIDFMMPLPGKFALTTMEFVEGKPLGATLRGLDVDITCELAIQLLRGLQFLHDSGFIHGDVKPSNVLCGMSGGCWGVKLLDYHLMFRPEKATVTQPRGTLRYMAPEVIAGGEADARSDLYSAGVLFYEALTGSSLFVGSPREVAAQHITAPVAKLKLGDKDIADRLASVLQRLLAKRPEARYGSASEAILAIGEALGRAYPPETVETLLGRIRSVPFVGSDDEVGRFNNLLSLSAEPYPSTRILLIRGQPGLGKTRLLRECEVCAQSLGFTTVRFLSDSDGHGILHSAEQLLGIGAKGGRSRTNDQSIGKSADYWHTRSAEFPGDVRPGGKHDSLALLSRLDHIAERLSHFCADQKTAFFLDGLDSIGPEDLRSLSFLMRTLAQEPVFYCFSLSETAVVKEPLQSWIRTWQKEGLVRQTVLHELDLESRRDLIAKMLPAATPATLVEALMETCGGSPQVITAALEHLVATGRLAVDAEGQVTTTDDICTAVPESIRRIGSQLLESVDERVRNALELLAVAEKEVELGTLANAVGLTPEVLRTAMENGPAAGVLSFRPTSAGALCRFQHQSFGDGLLELLPPVRLKSLHDQFAEAVECCLDGGSGNSAIQIAWHRLQGASPEEGVTLALKTLRQGGSLQEGALGLVRLALPIANGSDRIALLEIAGDMNMSRGASGEAAGYFQEALHSDSDSPTVHRRLLRKLASACATLGHWAEARDHLGRLAISHPDADRQQLAENAHAKLVLARTYFYESNFHLALENYKQVVDIGRGLGDGHLIGFGLLWTGITCLRKGAVEDACRALVSSLRIFRCSGDVTGVGRALASLGRAAMLKRNWPRAVDFLERALPVLREQGYLSEAARALSNLGSVHHKLCAWDRAAVHYKEALRLYERLDHEEGRSTLLANLSQVNASQGALELATEQAEEALEIAPDVAQLRCQIMLRMARVRYALGDLSAARETSLRALEVAVASNLHNDKESAHRTLGEIEWLRGRYPSAMEHLRSALVLAGGMNARERETLCLARLGEIAIASGDLTSALSSSDSACTRGESVGVESVRAVAHSVRGKVALAQNSFQDALAYLLKAEEVFAKTQVWDDFTDVALHLAKAYAALGQSRFAAYYFRTALEMVEQVANQLQSERNRSLFVSDPRRQELFDAIRTLRGGAESRKGISPARRPAT